MPAPKKPNTAAATQAAAEAARRRRDTRAAEWLRSRGWTVTPPPDDKDRIDYAGPNGREQPGEHWNARIIRERAEGAGDDVEA